MIKNHLRYCQKAWISMFTDTNAALDSRVHLLLIIRDQTITWDCFPHDRNLRMIK